MSALVSGFKFHPPPFIIVVARNAKKEEDLRQSLSPPPVNINYFTVESPVELPMPSKASSQPDVIPIFLNNV